MKQLSGKYSEIEFVRSDSARKEDNHDLGHSILLNRSEWDETVEKLAAMFRDHTATAAVSAAKGASLTQIKAGVVSSLQEDESRYYVTSVIKKNNDRLKLATVSWVKEPLESWLARIESHMPAIMAAPGGDYSLPKILEGGCTDNTWAATAAPPEARSRHTAVWTGSEMIIWGGLSHESFQDLNTGGRYNPNTDSWTRATG